LYPQKPGMMLLTRLKPDENAVFAPNRRHTPVWSEVGTF